MGKRFAFWNICHSEGALSDRGNPTPQNTVRCDKKKYSQFVGLPRPKGLAMTFDTEQVRAEPAINFSLLTPHS